MIRRRLLVADDLPPVLATIVALLEDSFDIVAKATDGPSALDAISRLKPDLAVLDISMPGMSGIEVAAELRRRGERAPIVFLTVHEDTDILQACQAAGGLGYVVKARMDADLIRAIEAAMCGQEFTSRFSNEPDGD
jgi:DNA-binding NarL/FixJ family response regulator